MSETADLIARLDRAVIDFNRGTEDLRPLLALASTALREERAAALEWAAGQVEGGGCPRECSEAIPSPDDVSVTVPFAGDEPHRPWCPRALAAKIREGAP